MKKGRRTSSAQLFAQLKALKLFDIFQINTLIFVYKAKNNLISSPIEFEERAPNPYNLRVRSQFQIPGHTSQQSERFIHVRGARLWNDIPESIKDSPSIFSFKKRVKKHYLDANNGN